MASLSKEFGLRAIRAGIRVPMASNVERMMQLADMKRLLTQIKVDCVFDVGANEGQFAKELRGIGFNGWIISFEPIQRLYKKIIETNDKKWLAYNLALSSKDEETNFNVTSMSSFSSFLTPVEQKVVSTEVVRCRRLDGILDECLNRTGATRPFLKMDTQGFDLEVVKGAGDRISEFVGLQSELSVVPVYESMPHYLDALHLYEQKGFKLRDLHVVNRTEDGGVLEYDCVMTRDNLKVDLGAR